MITALQEIDAEMRADAAYAADILAPMDILGVDRFTDSAVMLRARLQTKPLNMVCRSRVQPPHEKAIRCPRH